MKKVISFFSILIVIIMLILLYSRYIGTTGLNVNEYSIKYSKINDDFYGFKIVHISDILYGKTTDKKVLKNLLKQINLTKPDIVVLTGDLFNKSVKLTDKDTENITTFLKDMDANIGKYAIKGDNDTNTLWESIIENGGFINLNDKSELIYTKSNNSILISGLSSTMLDNNTNEKVAKLNIDNVSVNYSILIMHEPDLFDKIPKKYNLVLAGHNLGNSINISYINNLFKKKYATKYYKSHYKINETEFYISNGIGTDTYSFRLFNRPSFNLYRIIKK